VCVCVYDRACARESDRGERRKGGQLSSSTCLQLTSMSEKVKRLQCNDDE